MSAERQPSWTRADLWCALACACTAWAVYGYTLAPSVTMEDSGEFITAAAHLGVPHPPGYPLWTMLAWLCVKLLPFGNWAWRVNCLSAACGGAAVGMLALLIGASSRRFLASITSDPRARALPHLAAWTGSLVLALSESMWSQAVIAEVYTLNALILCSSLLVFYLWMHDTGRRRWLVLLALLLALGMSNHHTLFFVFPAFFIGVWLARRDFFFDFLAAICFVSASVLGVFAWLSEDELLIRIGWRLGIAAVALPLLWAFLNRRRPDLRLVSGIFVATWIGLLVYCYMPLASMTNPPMNWGFASEKRGFFHAVNRGQYSDNLAATIKNIAGPVIGCAPTPDGREDKRQPSDPLPIKLAKQAGHYFGSLEKNISLPLSLLVLCVLPFWAFFGQKESSWLWFTLAAFVGMAFFQMAVMGTSTDSQAGWVGRTFFLQSHCTFALWIGYGTAFGLLFVLQKFERLPASALWLAALAPVIPFRINHATCEQRGHWFGWQFGRDSLAMVEDNAVVFGGTDPGRFVTTYTIFCESLQPAAFKKDPAFDKSGVTIITQNALADSTYMKYIRAHYDESRRQRYCFFERWLGRNTIYPKETLRLPTQPEVDEIFQKHAEKKSRRLGGSPVTISGLEDVFAISGDISKKIFDDNKATRPFYVEESFPMEWYYPHAEPWGLFLKIHPEPLPAITRESLQRDRAFWDDYTARLLADPKFEHDRPARMGFSKLRHNIANIYTHRSLTEEAEYAYRQALRLAPDNMEATAGFGRMLIEIGRENEAVQLLAQAVGRDPGSETLREMHQASLLACDTRGAIREIQSKPSPLAPDDLIVLALAHGKLGEFGDMKAPVLELLARTNIGVDPIKKIAEVTHRYDQVELHLRCLERWSELEPDNLSLLAHGALASQMNGREPLALAFFKKWVAAADAPRRAAMKRDDRFAPLHSLPNFNSLLDTTPLPKEKKP